jgi:uncharacterized protein (TIGR03067 family)
MHAQSWHAAASGWLLLAAGLAAAQAPKEGAGGKERKLLAGTWRAAAYVLDGKVLPAENLENLRLVFDAEGKFKVQNAGKTILAGSVQIDPDKKPRTMDITYSEGDPKGQTSRAIYELDGDTLRMCCAAFGKARPTEFASKPGSGISLMTYKREKSGGEKK